MYSVRWCGKRYDRQANATGQAMWHEAIISSEHCYITRILILEGQGGPRIGKILMIHVQDGTQDVFYNIDT